MKAFFDRIDSFLASWSHLAPLCLRLGLAIVFLYAAVASTLDPREWIGYLPTILTDHLPGDVLLKGFSVYEVVLAVWLISGVHVRYAALLCAATLGGIVVSNISLLPISFRDIGLTFAALALALYSDTPNPRQSTN